MIMFSDWNVEVELTWYERPCIAAAFEISAGREMEIVNLATVYP